MIVTGTTGMRHTWLQRGSGGEDGNTVTSSKEPVKNKINKMQLFRDYQ